MLYRYSGINKNGEYRMGLIETSGYVEALKTLKNDLDIVAITNLKKQVENPFLKKTVEIFQKQIEVLKNSTLKNNKAKEKQDNKKNTLSQFKDLFKSKRIKKIEMDESMYDDLKELLKKDSDKSSKVIEDSNYDLFLKTQKDTKPKLLSEIKDNSRESVKEKKIDWSLFENQEDSKEIRQNRKFKVKSKEILLFTKRLQMMLSSGMTLLKSLSVLKETKNKEFRYMIEKIMEDLENGNTLSSALSKYPKQFDYTYVALISVGESSGTLSTVLLDIIESKEKMEKVNKKMKSASVYPIIIGIIMVILLIGASIFFIPAFKSMFEEQGYELPFITRFVFKMTDILPLIIVGLVVLIILFKKICERNKILDMLVKQQTNKIVLHLPIVSKILMASYMYNFSSTVSLMLKNGIRLKDTLTLTEKTINNIYIKSEILEMNTLMVQGLTFSEAMSRQKHFDEIIRNVILTGEESGKLSPSLFQISKYYNNELDKMIDIVAELIQPLSIILIAFIVIPIVLAVYLPIFDLSSGSLLGL